MNCPNCGAVMRERDRSGVKIDFCAECKGVWLDRGELDKIIAIELDDDDDHEGLQNRNAMNKVQARRRDDDDDDDDDDRRYSRGYDRDREYGEYRGKKKSKKSSFFESLTDMIGGGE